MHRRLLEFYVNKLSKQTNDMRYSPLQLKTHFTATTDDDVDFHIRLSHSDDNTRPILTSKIIKELDILITALNGQLD